MKPAGCLSINQLRLVVNEMKGPSGCHIFRLSSVIIGSLIYFETSQITSMRLSKVSMRCCMKEARGGLRTLQNRQITISFRRTCSLSY